MRKIQKYCRIRTSQIPGNIIQLIHSFHKRTPVLKSERKDVTQFFQNSYEPEEI
jgi:hypothetical protein